MQFTLQCKEGEDKILCELKEDDQLESDKLNSSIVWAQVRFEAKSEYQNTYGAKYCLNSLNNDEDHLRSSGLL